MRTRRLLITGAATAALTAASLTAVAATHDTGRQQWTRSGMMRGPLAASSCQVPSSLPGAQVTVALADMTRGVMGRSSGNSRMMGGRSTMGGQMMGGQRMSNGAMMLHANRQNVPAGSVSLVAVNHGSRTHELVVLPLRDGAHVGERTVRADDTVDEAGALGEASQSCGAGAGDGLSAGTAGWVTLTLKPGRYELVCNLPGHDAAGMYTELDVR